MVAINTSLANEVREFLDSGNREFLTHLQTGPRNDIESQAVVRYLMQLKHWPFTPDSDFATTLDHLFGEYPERVKRDPQEYQDTTFALIKNTFDYECIVVVPEPKPVVEEKPKAKRTKRATNTSSASHSDTSESDVDTDGASDRLKRVIAIQRAG